tara:strand:+ start:311 stop:805 length:495 start_codon:yes stop_codon:yes gene_type:complete
MKIIFEEKQKFNQWWLWIILFIFPILSIIPFNDESVNFYYILVGFAIPLLFYFLELRFFVTTEGLFFQFFPFHFKEQIIKIEEIKKIQAMKYNPLGDYGGWGIKYGFKGKAYNVRGNLGVKIFLKDGTNILFGSQQHKEFEQALKEMLKIENTKKPTEKSAFKK